MLRNCCAECTEEGSEISISTRLCNKAAPAESLQLHVLRFSSFPAKDDSRTATDSGSTVVAIKFSADWHAGAPLGHNKHGILCRHSDRRTRKRRYVPCGLFWLRTSLLKRVGYPMLSATISRPSTFDGCFQAVRNHTGCDERKQRAPHQAKNQFLAVKARLGSHRSRWASESTRGSTGREDECSAEGRGESTGRQGRVLPVLPPPVPPGTPRGGPGGRGADAGHGLPPRADSDEREFQAPARREERPAPVLGLGIVLRNKRPRSLNGGAGEDRSTGRPGGPDSPRDQGRPEPATRGRGAGGGREAGRTEFSMRSERRRGLKVRGNGSAGGGKRGCCPGCEGRRRKEAEKWKGADKGEKAGAAAEKRRTQADAGRLQELRGRV